MLHTRFDMQLAQKLIIIFFIFWAAILFLLIIPFGNHFWIAGTISLIITIIIGWYSKRSTKESSIRLFALIIRSSLRLGIIGFIIGFIGPIISTGANDGPLFGIFISGPLGFIVGAFNGFNQWLNDEKQAKKL